MSDASSPRLFVTGASGQLGRLVVDALLTRVPAERIVAGLRDPAGAAAASFRDRGIAVRVADYARPDTLTAAFAGIDRLLLISSSEIGQRVAQHRNVVEAAKAAGVGFLAYTSVLRADTSPLGLAEEHRRSEALVTGSGLPYALLRNGWYTENYTASIPPALAHGVFLGSAGEGRIASAARIDYAEAAAAVLTAPEVQAGRTYELAGDAAYTLAQFAETVAALSGKPVAYRDLPEAEFKAALLGAGLPDFVASLLADSDAAAAKGALDDDGHALSTLIGRPTTPFADTIAAALKG
ncbi:SDR family oxidoreductase [Methylobacterium organophilum]|uniref:Quinone oxidoreductase 2 n=1 Tax=Methylobacterium organophilum TaxID=410 RepID=A0ABQ4T578_METOR|nr:SDR family oxidoreductase [Methylobacterium organophilum]GJE25599.1 Quinone oxidoreductase 2 [Methylobacterium organophilum]